MTLRLTPATAALLAFLLFELSWLGWMLAADRTIDYYAYDLAGAALASGLSPYHLDQAQLDLLAAARGIRADHEVPPYRYSPFLASLLLPLQAVPVRLAAAIWSLASLAALTLGGMFLSQLMSRRWLDPRVFIGLMAFVPVLTTFHAGQVNHFMLLSLAVAAWAIEQRRDRLTGLALAAGILVKLVPISVAGVLLLRSGWRPLAWLVGFGLGLVLLTLPWTGLALYLGYLGDAFRLASADTPLVGSNQGLGAALLRMVGPAWGPLLASSLSALVAAGTLLAVWLRRREADSLLPSIGLAVVGVALLAPLSWIHHQVVLALPFVILLRVTRDTPRQGQAQWLVLACIALLDIVALAWKHLQQWPLLSSPGTWAMLLLWLALLRMLLDKRRPPPA